MKGSSKKLLALWLLSGLLQLPVFAQKGLDALYKSKQYFDLRDELAKHSRRKSAKLLFYRGVIANRFNQNANAIKFLRQYIASSDTDNLAEAYEELADSYTKTYQYRQAAETYKILTERFKDRISPEKIADHKNSYGLWNSLKDIAPQSTSITRDLRLQAKRDKADLLNLPVTINGQKMDLVFDTGANLPVITASTAKRLGLKIIESSVSVGSSTDSHVNSKLAVADVKIGDAVIKNAVFLVFDDRLLYFPQITYQINGIIGFPIIESLGNFTVTQKNEFIVNLKPANSKAGQNLCLDGLLPLVAGFYHGRRMTFSLDSGADRSMFYQSFFKADEQNIKKLAKPQKIKLGGAGGTQEVNGFIFDLDINIANKKARFENASVASEVSNENSKYLYGNLGQDLIKQFAKMTMNFKTMQIIFE